MTSMKPLTWLISEVRSRPPRFWAAAGAFTAVAAAAAVGVVLATTAPNSQAQAAAAPASTSAPASAVRPALTVRATTPQWAAWPQTVRAQGSLAAWQEASIGSESQGWRLAEVRAGVGDAVQRGQVLATFVADMPRAELAQAQASVAEAEAVLAEAAANAGRARELQTTGALSAQQIQQYLTAERTAQARLDALRAQARVMQLRVQHTMVMAPDAGLISARSATVGAVVPAGQELFRLVRQGRLEWRAEVPASEINRLRPGMKVRVLPSGAQAVEGTVRRVAPVVDAATRNGQVLVDLPVAATQAAGAKAGMFATGEFEVGQAQALTVPASAVQLRDGFAWVNVLVQPTAALSQVRQAKVAVGRRVGDRVEVTSGLAPTARIVESGGGFLADGDVVRVVSTAAAVTPAVTPGAAPGAGK
jgi:HlyD family secretion protein